MSDANDETQLLDDGVFETQGCDNVTLLSPEGRLYDLLHGLQGTFSVSNISYNILYYIAILY